MVIRLLRSKFVPEKKKKFTIVSSEVGSTDRAAAAGRAPAEGPADTKKPGETALPAS
jgi:hypothetical protein